MMEWETVKQKSDSWVRQQTYIRHSTTNLSFKAFENDNLPIVGKNTK